MMASSVGDRHDGAGGVRPGSLVAAGRTSDVFEFGRDAVVKVPRPDTPAHWAEVEADLTAAINTFGLPAPAVLDVVTISGRSCVVFERIDGPSMWERMLDHPSDVPVLIDELVTVQKMIHAAGLPSGLPDLTTRLAGKVAGCAQISDAHRREAGRIVAELPSGAAILHGDLHPGNVLMSRTGPMVIDWFDASIGHPLADVVRSSLLMRPGFDLEDRQHLRGANTEMFELMHRSYLRSWQEQLSVASGELRRWEAVMAVARIAEGADTAIAPLLALWEHRSDAERSSLLF